MTVAFIKLFPIVFVQIWFPERTLTFTSRLLKLTEPQNSRQPPSD